MGYSEIHKAEITKKIVDLQSHRLVSPVGLIVFSLMVQSPRVVNNHTRFGGSFGGRKKENRPPRYLESRCVVAPGGLEPTTHGL